MRDKKQDAQGKPNTLENAEKMTNRLEVLNQQRKNLQYFRLLTMQNQIIYLDEQKRYAIVQSRYLEDLKDKAIKTKQQIDQLSSQMKNQYFNQVGYEKLIELKNHEIMVLKEHIDADQKKIKNLQSAIEYQEDMLDQKQQQNQKCMQKNIQKIFNIQKQAKSALLMASFFQANHQYTQTQKQNDQKPIPLTNSSTYNAKQIEWHPQQYPVPKPSINYLSEIQKQSILTKKHEEQISKLKQNFQKMLEEITQKVGKKLEELERQKIEIKKWVNENRKLNQQNSQLRKTIKNINEEEEKIKIWRSTLSNFVENVQTDYKSSKSDIKSLHLPLSSMQNEQQQNQVRNGQQKFKYLNEQKIRMMQATIDRLQAEQRQRNNKLAQIREMIDLDDDGSKISQENIVGNLVNLSAKIKEVIKFLLEEI